MDLSKEQQLQRQIMEIPVREQRRIGEELHDGLGQQLSGLGMLATSLLNKASLSEHALASQLVSGLSDALTELRSLSRGLVSTEVNAENLISVLQTLADDIESHSHIPIHLEIDKVLTFYDDSTPTHLYRIIQEALNNAVKHASASEIRVSLRTTAQQGALKIIDDGCGIPEQNGRSSGIGLRIMKHRCRLFGGEFSAKAMNPRGTLVSCQFPLNYQVNTE